jgi:hypothetical protein
LSPYQEHSKYDAGDDSPSRKASGFDWQKEKGPRTSTFAALHFDEADRYETAILRGLTCSALGKVNVTRPCFCRIHQTLRVTPAMEAGLSDHVWSLTK